MSSRPPPPPESLQEALREAGERDHAIDEELVQVEESLREKGLSDEASELESVRREAPLRGGLVKRLGALAEGAREIGRRQLELLGREMADSRELVGLLGARASGKIKQFSDEEESLVRGQLWDLFRSVPATAIVFAPVPGIALISPFVLQKLNLLPSAWREAHVIGRLERTVAQLEERGETEEAARLRATVAQLQERHRDRSDRMRTLRQHPLLREIYDFDHDGSIDDEEWASIKQDRDTMRRAVARGEGAEQWFVSTGGDVEGPVDLSTLLYAPLPDHTLVRIAELPRWVPLDLLLEIVHESQTEEQGPGDV
jgi:hypothetical protein